MAAVTGNLIVGWDNAPEDGAVRSGSNNLVAGDFNNFTSYAGFVVGIANSLSNCYSSVSRRRQQRGLCPVLEHQWRLWQRRQRYVLQRQRRLWLTESTQFGWMAGSYQTP